LLIAHPMSRSRSIDNTLHSVFHNQPSNEVSDPSRGGRHGVGDSARRLDSADVRSAFSRELDLPRTETRERVTVKDRDYDLDASDVRSLATIGAFRVIDSRDLDATPGARQGDLERLRDLKLVEVVGPQFRDGERAALVTLTREGFDLLERHRSEPEGPSRQAYYAGLVKPREALHDAQLYRAYADAAARLHDRGARIHRVVLDYELKGEYQRFLQDANRGDSQSTGRPKRTLEEIEAWACSHGLPVNDGRVQFPDVRIEYEHPDGSRDREDLELATEHYTSRQMAGSGRPVLL
jgi:hypothetical protein